MDTCIECAPKASGSFLSNLFETDFVPRAACVGERPEIIWLHVLSDATIALSYFSIPIALGYFVRRRTDLSFRWMFRLFAAFIFACGATHVMAVFAFWIPMYRLDGVIKALTGGISAATALLLWPVIPKALTLPSPSDLRRANEALSQEVREKDEARARAAALAEDLEERVRARTMELELLNVELRRHRDELDVLVRERTLELEKSQQALQVSERMASLGTLAAGLGHDLGNILMPVRAWVDELERADLLPEDRTAVSSLRRAADYLRTLASGLRLLAVHPEHEDGQAPVTRLSAWWTDSAALYRAALPRGVALHQPEGIEEMPALAIPPHALTQAVFNLVQNAGDAMRERGSGSIRISARVVPRASEGDGAHGGRVFAEVSVSDDGPGMTPEVLARCMEPFFTTKTRGRGTGLGLPIVHSAIAQRGGEVVVASAVGVGTTFTLRIPVSQVSEGAGGARAVAVAARIQVADPRVAALARALAMSAGFEVVAAAGAAWEGEGTHERCLWIVDGAVSEEEVRLRVREGGVVVALGQHAGSGAESGVIRAAGTSVGAIREALARAAEAMRG